MRNYLIILFLGLFGASFAQEAARVKIPLPLTESVSELSINDGVISFNLGISAFDISLLDSENSHYIQLAIPEYLNDGLIGEPSLPVYSVLIEKKFAAAYQVELISLDSMIIDLDNYFEGAKIIPAQESMQKGRPSPKEEFIINNALYEKDEWIRLPLVNLVDEGIMRGVSIGRTFFNLVSYNPGRNQLKVYYNIRGTLSTSAQLSSGTETDAASFKQVLSPVIRESQSSMQKRLVKEQPVTMVILSDSIFSEALRPLVEWKRKKGFHVIEAYTGDPAVGNDRTSIKSYLSGLYHSPPAGIAPPSFLLIVGDVEHVPLSQGSGQITDLYYTTYDGDGDFLPDLFQGRISVKADTQLTAVVEKILEYEQYKFPEPDFLNRSILIAGYDNSHASTWGNGQINYASTYYFNPAHGIEANTFLHPEASDSDAVIREAISEGAALVNYTGHGTSSGWIDPAFSTAHIAGLSNSNKYPVLLGNGCRTNVFNQSSDCFAEASVKAKRKGALAYIGCTNDSYWDEDFYWAVGVGPITANPEYEQTTSGFYDKVFHEGAELIEDWTPSLGEMIFGGNMAVQQSNSLLKQYYWEIYQLMGDPSLVPWFTEPGDPAVDFPASLAPDASLVVLQTEAYDYTAISVDGVLLDAKHADASGQSSLFIPEEYRGDTLLLVITGDYRQPFIRQIPDLGHFELLDLSFSNESVLEDGILSNGEQVSINIKIKNTSIGTSEECNLNMRVSENLTPLDSLVLIPSAGPGDTIELLSAFSFRVKESVMDQSRAMLSFIREADITLNTLDTEMPIYAPDLVVSSVTMSDELYANGNNIIESGELIALSIELENKGSFMSDSIEIMFGQSDTIFGEKRILKGQKLLAGDSHIFSTEIQIPVLTGSEFYMAPIVISDGNYILEEIYLVIGKYIEDFSTDSLWLLPWTELDWYRDTLEYLTSPASLRSAQIDHRSSTSAGIKVHVFEPDSIVFNYKVSSEPGYDHLKFYVDGEETMRWSGESGWQEYTQMLPTGLHELKWSYVKDGNTVAGDDAAWIDKLIFPANAFVPDLYIDSIDILRHGSELGEESFSIIVNNIGLDTINDFSVRYRNNDQSWQEVAFQDTLVPGIKKKIEINGIVDLSEVRMHTLQVVIRAPEDIWPWNDTLTALIDHYAYPDLSIDFLGYDSLSGDYVNLLALIENMGNVKLESFFYNVTIDDDFSFVGKATIGLEPGSATEVSLNLINEYHDWLETGWHDYTIELAADSVLENNILSGSVYWIVSSLEELLEAEIRLYPNPASDVLIIELHGEMKLPGKIEIRDVMGRELVMQRLDQLKEKLFLGGMLPSDGVYYITIRDLNGVAYKGRFIYIR